MKAFLLILLLQCGLLASLEITGNGNPTMLRVWEDLQNAYRNLLQEDITFRFNITNVTEAMRFIIDGAAYFDYGVIDSANVTANQTKINPYYKTFPILVITPVPQINLPEILPATSIALSREALSGIYLGDITNWQDPRITKTNPQLNLSCIYKTPNPPTVVKPCLPNQTIKAIYRADPQPFNVMWGLVINSLSGNNTWMKRYGMPTSVYPAALTNRSNFVPARGALAPNARGLVDYYSIAYSGYNFVIRDPQVQYAKVVNKYNNTVTPDGKSVSRAASYLQLGDDLKVNYVIEPNDEDAWPWASFLQIMVTTRPLPSRCAETRALYKFIKWVFTSEAASSIISMGGFAPLPHEFAAKTLESLATIQCGNTTEVHAASMVSATSVLVVDAISQRNAAHVFLLVMTTVVLFLVLFMAASHLYLFHASRINLVYSMIFLLGALITLTAPYAWYIVPTQDDVCLARVWLTSVGLSVLLGTMFSRTWQLRDIYLLQKKKLQDIQRNTTVRSSLIKLSVTLSVVVLLNLLLLIIWTTMDPYRSTFEMVDELRLTGRWSCVSDSLSTWLLLQCVFLLCVIAFGVYVIYYTWSFQKKSLIEETRWVLIALYNIALNLTAVVPIVAISPMEEESLSILMTVSIIFSGGGVIFAFLLPRTLKGLCGRDDEYSSDSGRKGTIKHGSHPGSSHQHESSDHRKEVDSPQSPHKHHLSTTHNDLEIQIEKKDTQLELQPLKKSPSMNSAETSVAKDDQGTADELTISQRPLLNTILPSGERGMNRLERDVAEVPASPSRLDAPITEASPSVKGSPLEGGSEGGVAHAGTGGWRVYFPHGTEQEFSGSLNWASNPLSKNGGADHTPE